MKILAAYRNTRAVFAALAGAFLLSGCWGWIPEDPAPPEAVPGASEAPAGTEASAARPPERDDLPPPAPAPSAYSVVAGDTLFSIAWRFRLKVSDLAAWNSLGDGSLILAGQRLRLTPPPGWKSAASASPAATAKPEPASAPAKPEPGSSAPASGAASASKPSSSSSPSPGSASRPASSPAAASRPSAGGGKWRWPAQGRVDAKGARVRAGDYGVRIMGQSGQNVQAADGGKVMYAGDGLKAYGLLVIVQHSPEWLSAYGHNEKILVKEGEEVRAGQPIATMGIGPGNTPMLHFEIRRNGKPVEPIGLLPPRN